MHQVVESGVEAREQVVDVALAGDQRWHQAHHGWLVARVDGQDAVLGEVEAHAGTHRVFGVLDSGHQAEAPDISDLVRMGGGDGGEAGVELRPSLGGILEKAIFFDHVDDLEGHHAGHVRAAEGRQVDEGVRDEELAQVLGEDRGRYGHQ